MLSWPIEGDVNYLSVFNKSILILNSFSAARDLLEQRGVIYSSRPTLVMLCDMWGRAPSCVSSVLISLA
jgi:hypothetical protein